MLDYSQVLVCSRAWREEKAVEVELGGRAAELMRRRHGREGGPRCASCERGARLVDRVKARGQFRRRGAPGAVEAVDEERAAARAKRVRELDVDWTWEAEEQGLVPEGWTWPARLQNREVARILRGSAETAVEAEEELAEGVPRDARAVSGYRRRCRACRVFQGPVFEVRPGARWHETRADAHRTRGERKNACGSEAVEVRCRCCKAPVVRRALGCGSHVICEGCRKVRARREAIRVRRLVEGLGEAAGEASCVWSTTRTRVSRWRFFTLTFPHVGTAEFRSRVMTVAWPRFLRSLNAFLWDAALRESHACGVEPEELRKHWHWIRKGEVTVGDDGEGHWHFHVLAHGPFVPQARLVAWWREALEESGLPRSEYWTVGAFFDEKKDLRGPVCDVRAVRDDDVANEVAKYVAKEFSVGRRMTPELVSEVWRWCASTRTSQSSAGLAAFAPVAVQACSSCGAARCVPRRVVIPPKPVELRPGGVAVRGLRGVDLQAWFIARCRYAEAVRLQDEARESAIFVAVLDRERRSGS